MYTLITGATSAQAYKLKNALQPEQVILGDYLDLPATMLASGAMIKLPNPASASYAHEMLTLCLDRQVDNVYPLKDAELRLLSEAEQLFGEYGIKISKHNNEPLNQ